MWKETFPKLAHELNFIPKGTAEDILTDIIYPKIQSMSERKQDRKRRLRGLDLAKDLNLTQFSNILISAGHKKMFAMIQTDPNFIYRVEMAASIGNI